jgi:hypothetical protein
MGTAVARPASSTVSSTNIAQTTKAVANIALRNGRCRAAWMRRMLALLIRPQRLPLAVIAKEMRDLVET